MQQRPPQVLSRSVRQLAFALVAMALACGSNPSTANDPAAAQYVQQLPAFPTPGQDFDQATGPTSVTQNATEVCNSTPYSLSSAPKDVVMFNADPQIMWPGALIVGTSYQNGSMQLLPFDQRAPIKVSIQGVYAADTSATVDNPTASSVTAAINNLLSKAVKDQTVPTNSIYYTQTSAYSLDQSVLKLGFSAHYLGASAKGALSVQSSSSESSVVAYALVRMFTVAVDPPSTPDTFFQGLTQDALKQQEDLNRIGPNNVPVYVASVTYGQLMMFSATASASASEIKGALSASFNGFVGGGSASLSGAQKTLLQNSTIEVATLGGNGNAVRSAIINGQPADFFIGTDLISNAVPIAYTLKDLDNNVAKVAETTDYALTTCTQNGFANIYVLNEANGNNGTVTGYYADASRATLNTAIGGLTAPQGIADDTLDDALFVLDYAGGVTPRVQAFAPDGSASSVVTATSPFPGLQGPTDMAYDPQRARLYVVDKPDVSGFGIVRAYTPQGDLLNLFFDANKTAFMSYSIAYDHDDQLIFVGRSTGSESGGFVTVFKYDGTDVTPASGFDGLVLPEGMAWDHADGRLYVSDYFQGKVLAFDKNGTAIPLARPITQTLPRGMVFDETHNRLYVAVQGSSTVEAFEPDGTPVTDLATPAFPDVTMPTAIIVRP